MLTSQCHFDGPLLELGLPEANEPPHGHPEVYGPRGHCPFLPPLSAALTMCFEIKLSSTAYIEIN